MLGAVFAIGRRITGISRRLTFSEAHVLGAFTLVRLTCMNRASRLFWPMSREGLLMAPAAPYQRRRRCYANSRLLQLPRLRWQWRPWRPLPPLPGTVGMAVMAITAGVGAVPASTPPRLRIMVTAAAMCGGWSRPHGALVGASSIVATEHNGPMLQPRPLAGAFSCAPRERRASIHAFRYKRTRS